MSDRSPKVTFRDIPPEVLLDRLLPVLAIKDLLSFSQVDRELNSICNDESHWLHRTRLTFAYNPHTLAPSSPGSGWSKRLYIGLSHPEPFVWGSADNNRLGLPERRGPNGGRVVNYSRRVNRPQTLSGSFQSENSRTWSERLGDDLRAGHNVQATDDRGVEEGRRGIVEMHAGGWSFAARDMNGVVWVWDGDIPSFRSTGWTDKHERVPEPTPIPLPCRAEAISVGRAHMLILDEDNLIWEMREWGRAYHHTSPSLISPNNPGSTRRPHHIAQLSTGWSHSACLTSTGRIYVWFPFSQAYTAALTPLADLHGPLGVKADGDEKRAVRWGSVSGDAVEALEEVPEREKWDVKYDVGEAEEMEAKEKEWDSPENRHTGGKDGDGEKVIKIASGQGFVVALKASGEVWVRLIDENRQAEWEYLPHFSSPHITHISAQFSSLTSYSTLPPSKLNHARLPSDTSRGFGSTFRPDDLPSLQGKGVIQVAIGDYHFAALTSHGEMWTWGQGSAGQLGLGEVGMTGGSVAKPRKVEFRTAQNETEGGDNKGKGKAKDEEPFVFAITAAGWHTGALVLGGLEHQAGTSGRVQSASDIGTSTDPTDNMPGAFPDATNTSLRSTFIPGGRIIRGPVNRPGSTLPYSMPQFRVGLAGGLGAPAPAPLESQAGEGDQEPGAEIPDPAGSSRPERNWVRTSRREGSGSAGPAPQGDDM